MKRILTSIAIAASLASCGAQNDSIVKKIIGADDRVLIPDSDYELDEFKAVGKLYAYEDGSRAYDCTATLIEGRYVITSAHCIYIPGTWHKFEKFTWASMEAGGYGIESDVEEVWTGYDGKEMKRVSDDWAIVKLADDLSDKIKPHTLKKYSTIELRGKWASYIGFGGYGDYSDSIGVQRGCNEITVIYDKKFGYKCDTEQGASGGPVFDEFGNVIGVHKGADKRSPFNFAVRVDDALKKLSEVK